MNFKIKVVPLAERIEIISQRVENTQETEKLFDFRGGAIDLPVVRLEIGLLLYRMDNCRTFSEQQNKIAVAEYDAGFFLKGQEKTSAQAAQHNILSKLASKSTASVAEILKTLDEEGQREPLLITSSGVVVNGNRRLSAFRELNATSEGKRFSHIACYVLPSDTTPDELDDIEADMQGKTETKMPYDWIGEAQLVRRQVNKGRTPIEVGRQLRRTPADIKNLLASLDEADLYLASWLNKPGQYAIIENDAEQIFSDIPKKIANKPPALEEASRAIAWTLFENREKLPGRLYSFNDAFGSLAEKVMIETAEALDIDLSSHDENASEDGDFLVDIDEEEAEISYSPVIKALKDEVSKADAVEMLIDRCESAIEFAKGLASEKAALKALTNANSKISGIAVEMAGKATLPGILKQIETIRMHLDLIEKAVEKRNAT